jgi:hypothetical protein
MNLKQKLVSSVGILALSLSMTAGAAVAKQVDDDMADTVLNVVCPYTQTVDVNVLNSFSINASSGAQYHNASLPGGFEMILDLRCNWSTDFQVDAKIGEFKLDRAAAPGAVSSFSGRHLDLEKGTYKYEGPTFEKGWFQVSAGAPDVQKTVFEGSAITDKAVIEDDSSFFFPQASPGITTAKWDGHLRNLPGNLSDGNYVAPLTVTLAVS